MPKQEVGREANSNLEGKIWYRLVKVVYILVFIIAVLLVSFLAYDSKPRTFVKSDESQIRCTNGKFYPASGNNIFFIEDLSKYLNGEPTTFDVSDEDEKARKLCEYGIINDYLDKYKVPATRNYTVHLITESVGSWEEVGNNFAIGITIVVVVLETIKRTFLYIAVGKKFLS